jgi:RNA polymerase sigma-70 factor (ECF subfamily)
MYVLRLVRFQKPAAPAQGEVREAVDPVDPLAALAVAAVDGNREAQRTLLVALGPALLRAVRGVLGAQHPDVEDVLQESMSASLAALTSFRGECQIVHFACRVGVQTAMNARRRASYRARYTPNASPDELAELARDEHSPAEAYVAAARRAALSSLLDELPPAQSEALVLHTVLGYSVEETARTTGAPVNTVRSRLRAALAALRARVHTDRALLERLDGLS